MIENLEGNNNELEKLYNSDNSKKEEMKNIIEKNKNIIAEFKNMFTLNLSKFQILLQALQTGNN